MASLKEIRVRIASVESTQKITSAMKMVSAAKLRRAQTTIVNLRPYSHKMSAILSNLLSESNDEKERNPLEEVRTPERVVVVLISSNKGLCGGFNNSVTKYCEAMLAKTYAKQHQAQQVEFICIGKKVTDYVKKKKYPMLASYTDLLDNISFEATAEIADILIQRFVNKEVDKVEIIYNQFKNAATQVLTKEQYLPVVFEGDQRNEKEENKNNADFIFEPEKEELYQQLVPALTKMKFYQSVLESLASEHGARMTAMHKATENAKELTKELNLTYNKLRQTAITNELIEMVSGAASMQG